MSKVKVTLTCNVKMVSDQYLEIIDGILSYIGYKTFFMLNSAENEICSAYKKSNTKHLNIFSCTAELSMNFFLLIIIKMPTFVGILMFIGWENFMLS